MYVQRLYLETLVTMSNMFRVSEYVNGQLGSDALSARDGRK